MPESRTKAAEAKNRSKYDRASYRFQTYGAHRGRGPLLTGAQLDRDGVGGSIRRVVDFAVRRLVFAAAFRRDHSSFPLQRTVVISLRPRFLPFLPFLPFRHSLFPDALVESSTHHESSDLTAIAILSLDYSLYSTPFPVKKTWLFNLHFFLLL